jgi:phenylalanyl-tRNA synthetase beta chain
LTFGKTLPNHDLYEGIRNIMRGQGFNEVTTFTISNEQDEFRKLGLNESKRSELENPIGEDYTCLRVGLIPSLLKILNENRHHPLPQQIFELGIIVDNNFNNRRFLSFVKIDAKANFTECKSYTEAILRDSVINYTIKNKNHPGFINGRCASIVVSNSEIGFFGELHPKTITNFELEYPIIAFQIDVNNLIQ